MSSNMSQTICRQKLPWSGLEYFIRTTLMLHFIRSYEHYCHCITYNNPIIKDRDLRRRDP